MRLTFLVASAFASSFVSATETVPFYVSKVSASGEYSSEKFKTLWSAFRQEYSLTSNGGFSPYLYTEYVLKNALEVSSRKASVNDHTYFQLFYDPEKKEKSQYLTGNQEVWKTTNKYVNQQLAMDGARRFRSRLVTLSVGGETATPGTYLCTMTTASVRDEDVRDAPDLVVAGSATTIIFCDPKNPRTGQATLYIESRSLNHSVFQGSQPGNYSALREVGAILDTKDNQDNFMAALKAGSSFRTFWFKEITCTNCGGLGRLSTLAMNQAGGSKSISGKGSSSSFGSRNANLTNSALSLTPGASAAADKCPACVGTGKRMRGYLSTLMWDDKGPTFDPSK